MGCFNEVCFHMTPKLKWNKEAIRKEASKYKTSGELLKNCKSAYAASKRLDIFDSLF